jgi:hypothetical protein
LGKVNVQEAFVVSDVEIGLGAVISDEDLAVLERVHCSWVYVEVGVKLLHDHSQTASGEKIAEASRRQAFTE